MSGPVPVKNSIAELTRLLVRSDRLAELLPQLHLKAVEAVNGTRSVMLQEDAHDGRLHATSGFRLEQLAPDGWVASPHEIETIERIFERERPTVVSDLRQALPSIAERLDTGSALLVPLQTAQHHFGLLAIARDDSPLGPDAYESVSSIADLFLIALERAQMMRDADLQRDLGSVFSMFSRSVSSPLALTAGLETFCSDANRLFGAARTSVWIHDRRARDLVLDASSDPEYLVEPRRVSTTDSMEPAAVGLRRDRAEMMAGEPSPIAGESAVITVPLRGRRRALGTLVFEGIRADPGSRLDLLERADEVGRQLSFAIENVQLFEEVLRSHREIENTFNSIADLVAVFDRELRLIHVNQAFAERIGQVRDDILDQPITDFVSPDTGRWIKELDLVAPSTPDQANAASIELEDGILQGTFSITITALMGHEQMPIGSVMVARDVTHQAKLEAEQAELRNRLLRSEKLAALGQFIAGIAHELNNPLQGVLGHLELLRATGAFPKALRRDVQVVYREADRAAKIVRNLLVFAGSRRLARRRISVNAVVSRALALRGAAFRAAGIELLREYDDSLPRVSADPLLIQQAVLNIVINAEHALENQAVRRILVQTAHDQARGRLCVRVRDTGPGLSIDVLTRIFEPFFTTKDVGKGTGLGLAIAYGIIQEHGGLILASNHPDGGAMFTIELPVHHTEKPPSRTLA
jgi:PAS domain S-box-containing protein